MADYDDGKRHIIPDFTYEGCLIRWLNVDQKDRATFRQIIEEYAAVFTDSYIVDSIDVTGANMSLNLLHHNGADSDPTERQRLKGDVFMLIGDTRWGGGSG